MSAPEEFPAAMTAQEVARLLNWQAEMLDRAEQIIRALPDSKYMQWVVDIDRGPIP